MRILILDTYYLPFQSSFRSQHPGLSERSYNEHWRALMDQCFGTADFYSSNLQQLGHEAIEIVTNYEPLQKQWAREHGLKLDESKKWTLTRRRGIPLPRRVQAEDWFHTILAAQIKEYRPDVLYVQDMTSLSADFLRLMRPHVKLIAGQIASPIPKDVELTEYDLVLSSLPHFVERFRREGLKSEYLKLGFEPKVLERLGQDRHHGAVFIGSLSTDHAERIRFLETVSAIRPLDIWGQKSEKIDRNSPLLARHHGEAWALEMYQLLHGADVTLNHHIDLAESYANNMRLFEATGVGTLLITDWKVNLHEMFDVGSEVVAYRTAQECAELIAYYMAHEDERKMIARAGQERTLREHTYYQRMQELVAILERYLSQPNRAGSVLSVGSSARNR